MKMTDALFDDLFNPAPDPDADEIFAKTIARDAPALDGLSGAIVDAITARITPEMVRAFVAQLSRQPVSAESVRRYFAQSAVEHPWFPRLTAKDTQYRFLRTIRDAAIDAGYPVCSMNEGYVLGDQALVRKSAERARALARGALDRARQLDAIAERMTDGV